MQCAKLFARIAIPCFAMRCANVLKCKYMFNVSCANVIECNFILLDRPPLYGVVVLWLQFVARAPMLFKIDFCIRRKIHIPFRAAELTAAFIFGLYFSLIHAAEFAAAMSQLFQAGIFLFCASVAFRRCRTHPGR